jgi:hypothetical protein
MTKSYHAYLLRLWQTDDLDQPAWRASLEDPVTRQVTGFSSLEALCAYLLQQKSSPAKNVLPPNEVEGQGQ